MQINLLHGLRYGDMLCDFTAGCCQWYLLAVFRFWSCSLLEIRITRAVFQSPRKVLVSRVCWMMIDSMGHSCCRRCTVSSHSTGQTVWRLHHWLCGWVAFLEKTLMVQEGHSSGFPMRRWNWIWCSKSLPCHDGWSILSLRLLRYWCHRSPF